jgi:hypothetical protein
MRTAVQFEGIGRGRRCLRPDSVLGRRVHFQPVRSFGILAYRLLDFARQLNHRAKEARWPGSGTRKDSCRWKAVGGTGDGVRMS